MESEQKNAKKGMSFKTKIIIAFVLILSIVSAAFYLYIVANAKLKDQYTQGIKYLETLVSEQIRCSDILSQEKGNFGDYEYCRRLLQIFPKK